MPNRNLIVEPGAEVIEPQGPLARLLALLLRILISVAIPAVTIAVLIVGFRFLRDSEAPKLVIAMVAIVWGVAGVAMLYFGANYLVEQLPDRWTALLQPYIFVGPAVAILSWYLLIPSFRTFYISLFDRTSEHFVGLQNYIDIFTQRELLSTFRNNLMWIVFGATFAVVFGLIIAVLADRSKFERTAKALIFLPMAISFVGAGIIWNFIYEVKDISAPQIGLLNAIVVALGGQPRAWTAVFQPWNNLFLIVIVVWLQTGFAMVLFSAAIKGIPSELIEAARVDGASEIQIFFRIMIPYIMGTIITVSTTIVIFTLKIFDVVIVMTGGQFGTEVIATQFYRQYFTNRNFGLGSAFAIILLIAVIPVMIYNLRQFREQEGF
ncbi:MAG: sugar ABC transporter permease [Chloroflexi bacterium]|nr:sugar ABC transporter permease [Chloroflexota bacterium]